MKVVQTRHLVVLAGVVLAGTFGTAITAAAQDFDDLQTPKSPLVLEAHGSFYVGGALNGATGTNPYMVDQMYVRYLKPKAKGPHHTPVVMVEGGGLTGKSYETTPDGRMGWDEYIARNGHATYVVDAPWRGRSGFNPTCFNPPPPPAGCSQPFLIPSGTAQPETAWVSFRVGPTFDVAYDDTQFPTEHINQFAKQGYPTFSGTDPTTPFFPHAYQLLSDLATELEGAVLMGHSFSGFWPINAALIDPTVVKGMIVIDSCPGLGADNITDEQLQPLADQGIPIVGVMGDHRSPAGSGEPGAGGPASCDAFITRYNGLGGGDLASLIYPHDLGIFGNTHVMMVDENNQEIADLILKWLAENVD